MIDMDPPPRFYIDSIRMDYEPDHEKRFPAVVEITVCGIDSRAPDQDSPARVQLRYRGEDEPKQLQSIEIQHRNPDADQLNPAIEAFAVRHMRRIGFSGELPKIDQAAEYAAFADRRRSDSRYSDEIPYRDRMVAVKEGETVAEFRARMDAHPDSECWIVSADSEETWGYLRDYYVVHQPPGPERMYEKFDEGYVLDFGLPRDHPEHPRNQEDDG